jgi:hypothetical protein
VLLGFSGVLLDINSVTGGKEWPEPHLNSQPVTLPKDSGPQRLPNSGSKCFGSGTPNPCVKSVLPHTGMSKACGAVMLVSFTGELIIVRFRPPHCFFPISKPIRHQGQ